MTETQKNADKKVRISRQMIPVECALCKGMGGTMIVMNDSHRDPITKKMTKKTYRHTRSPYSRL